jgi:hypothetical protein
MREWVVVRAITAVAGYICIYILIPLDVLDGVNELRDLVRLEEGRGHDVGFDEVHHIVPSFEWASIDNRNLSDTSRHMRKCRPTIGCMLYDYRRI